MLHDIGKFYLRSKTVKGLVKDLEDTSPHPIVSTYLIKDKFKELIEKLELDSELLIKLIRHHHESPLMPKDCQVQSLRDKEKALAYIVSRADNYSSSERYKDEDGKFSGATYETAFMDSIFSKISLNGESSFGDYASDLKLRPSVFSPENVFPVKIESADWEKLTKSFGKEVSELASDSFDNLYINLLSIINKYCWSTPSDITVGFRDISLSDHLKTSSAIAACLYLYHFNTNSLDEKSIKDEQIDKFMFIAGDLSGIQNYIFDIAKVGVGGVAKRLRARSLRLSLLMEVTAHFILQKLGLPYSCLIFSSGGKFYILTPADDISLSTFEETKEIIEDWLFSNFLGEVSIALTNITFSPSFFSAQKDPSSPSFRALWTKLSNEIEKNKKRKLSRFFIKNNLWRDNFTHNFDYFMNNQKTQGPCNSCSKFPVTDLREGKRFCNQCSLDLKIGAELLQTKTNYLAFYDKPDVGEINFYNRYSVKFFKQDNFNGEPYLVFKLNDTDLNYRFPSAFKFIAYYVPFFKNQSEAEEVCNKCLLTKEKRFLDCEVEKTDFPQVYTFSCLANLSEGAKYIGVLKADVDHLGLIINKGITNLTISRLSTFSNFLDCFFSGYLNSFLSEKYQRTYVVYAGGDDLMFCGPWNEIVQLSKDVAEKFKNFVAFNPNLHLSAAIVVARQKTPFSFIATKSSEFLEKAKKANRNNLFVFDTVIPWKDLDDILDFSDSLANHLEQKKISTSFVYNLLNFYQMHKRAKAGDNYGYIYLPRLADSIRRNLYDSNDKPKISKTLLEKIKKLLDPKEAKLMESLKFIVSYALLKERGYKNES